ncbi:MAG: BON domain-containing protein [Planctomycetes bacterium]|nr:BON domain-containing protein [Planctomycetota bacterium]
MNYRHVIMALAIACLAGNAYAFQPRPRDSAEEVVADSVRQALAHDSIVRASSIDVRVRNGVVTLSGKVDDLVEKLQAGRKTARVYGVVGVRNLLTVAGEARLPAYAHWGHSAVPAEVYWYRTSVSQSRQWNQGHSAVPAEVYWYGYRSPLPVIKSDEQFRLDIVRKLWWSPFVDGDAIEVSVERGVATLSGRVGSRASRDAAIEIALGVGAVSVRDKLQTD